MTTSIGRNPERTALRVRISLTDVTPAIWRRVLVPAAITLPTLHSILQAAMGWGDSHLHAFEIDGERYGIFDPEEDDDDESDEATVVLADVVSHETRFIYEYDFGDSWRHEVVVEAVDPIATKLKFAVCVDGARACPPEDCGGVCGYRAMGAALEGPPRKKRVGSADGTGGAFDPEAFDLSVVNAALQQVR